jgi:protein-tyrosine kinase
VNTLLQGAFGMSRMDIRKAADRAGANRPLSSSGESRGPIAVVPVGEKPDKRLVFPHLVQLDRGHLESTRIIAHDIADSRSTAFDMLRTQILQAMGAKGWRLIAVTSPTPACGKTLTAANLAISIARQPDRAVLLLDLDLRKPQIGASLGLQRDIGLLSALEGKVPLKDAIITAAIDRYRLDVLIAERPIQNSSEWMASRNMRALLGAIRREYPNHIVVIDTPPMLATDDVLTVLPQLDCVLLVGAVGTSTVSDIEQCKRHLHSTHIVRVVLNKVRETNRPYYG